MDIKEGVFNYKSKSPNGCESRFLFLSRHQCPLSQRPELINFDGGGLSGEIEGLGGERFPK